MSHAVDSKSAAAELIDPFTAPEPSANDGPGSHFGNTMARSQPNAPDPASNIPRSTSLKKPSYTSKSGAIASSTVESKSGASSRVRASSQAASRSSPSTHRAEAFGDYEPSRRRAGSHGNTPPSYHEATASGAGNGSDGPVRRHRRSSSLKERFPGDHSHEPLQMLRKDSKKAYRSQHLSKRSLPGTDTIDRLDPAIGGRSYHHEGPYDAALMSRNTNQKYSPVAALKTSNAEALKATPPENIKDAVERHMPLDGVAAVPPGMPDRFGRKYNYNEGSDLMHEGSSGDPGLKRYPDLDYDREDIKGESEPMFSLDRALKAHRIDENGIELDDRSHLNREYHERQRKGTLDQRDPVEIAGDESRYGEMTRANAHDNDAGEGSSHGLKANLKKRIGSLKHRRNDE